EVLGSLKGRRGVTRFPFTACVITDFEAHALWMEPVVDLYCVAADETKARLVARSVQSERVAVTGIPIGVRFSETLDVASIRREWGFGDALPTILVLGGGFGMGPVEEILAALDRVERAFQTVVVAGRNIELRQRLSTQDRRHPTHVLGFVTNMHRWMMA